MSPHLMASTAALFCLCACANGPAALLREAAGSVSQNLCTKTLASSLSPGDVMRDHLLPEPGMSAIAWGLRYVIDHEAREVRTSVFGGSESRSVFREGRGCTLVYPGHPAPQALTPSAHAPALLPDIAEEDVVAPQDARLVAALDAAFAEPEHGPPRNTQAVVVVRGGRIIAERYASGLNTDTALLSHSIAKSMVNALVGVLVREGRMHVDDPAPVDAWRGDERGAINIDNLLRMNAGFGFDEGGGASIATHIWYTEPDMALAAAQAELESAPGEQWGYTNRPKSRLLNSRAPSFRTRGARSGTQEQPARRLPWVPGLAPQARNDGACVVGNRSMSRAVGIIAAAATSCCHAQLAMRSEGGRKAFATSHSAKFSIHSACTARRLSSMRQAR